MNNVTKIDRKNTLGVESCKLDFSNPIKLDLACSRTGKLVKHPSPEGLRS